ncbi:MULTISPECIES: DUF4214 domain-containing protein [Marivita]|uniref:DUF4214 domain-containing protein n=2 Tax=Marivita cryptomonadis TaxID=505252 RepID=A0A9Q2RWT5_9RHOB|nr:MULTISPECIES: DUF4214 domain-containing protein [Marivita]MBM2321226.1 DUF4214 domain-containing protein [Marivita cryptomonadis]MBM2330807.1 DUF4214 domain-containing protein [Marivita cryptomonadis]MBM2340393.1 DUF4214 domain-containing protein [Marivita cryptomonadis]MBM2345055.1 DUF4214 domain-containing protein [Marivita cryptomonadis]MBM2349733.1 DUF4214 domain-containing protein [Marivita cryptomonadis]
MEEFPDFDSSLDSLENFGSAIAGVPALGGISGPNDFADWFEVALTAGNQYEIQLRGAATNDGTLNDPYFVGVYDDLGDLIQGTTDNDNGSGLNSQVLFTAPYSGTYYFSAADAASFIGSSNLGLGGTYTLEYFDLTLPEVINEGDDITFSIPTEIPSNIPFPGSGSLDDFIVDQQISVIVTSDTAINGEDFTVSYSFGAPQSLTFTALSDDLVEDDESVSVRVFGTVDWSAGAFGGTTTTEIDLTRSFTINSAPYGVPDPIQNYSFTEPEVIGNVLTNFADGSEELFTAIPFTFESPTATGELLANGDLLINSASGTAGQSLLIRFTAIDERGARTEAEQIVEFGTLDDYLPGVDALEFGSIDVGTSELGSIEQLDDRDRFVVSLEAGQLYAITLNSASDGTRTLADPEIFGVFDSLNNLVPDSSDNDNGQGLNAQAGPFVVGTTGSYEIEVGSHTPFGLGGYELTILSLGFADDYLPGTFAESFGFAEVDVPVSGDIERIGDRDRFDISLIAGAEYDISLEGLPTGGGTNPNMQIVGLFSSTGAFIAGSSDSNNGVDTNALVTGLTVPTDGVYQVEVAGQNDTTTGDYTLTVDFTGFVDDFLPGISGGLGSVAVGGRATGEIETTGDIDAFRVSLQANTTYEINLLGQASNNGTLLDPELLGIFSSSDISGSPIGSVQTLNQQLIEDNSVSYFTPQSAGEYFIAVQDAFDGLGTYTVEVIDIGVRDDFSADIETTGTITPGGAATGRIDFTSDNDWFEVNLTANRLYEISLVPLSGGNALADPFFNGVYDSSGRLIQNTSNDDGGVGTSSALQFVADQSGTYYLSAGGFGDTTGQYRLELNDLGPLDDGRFDITIEFASGDVSDDYISAFEDAVERWEDIITGDLPYAFVEGYGYVDDILIEVAVEDIELSFEGVSQTVLAISSVLDQRDGLSGEDPLPTYSRIVINAEEVGTLLNLDEFVANTIGRALGFGALWEEFGIVRLIDGVPTYTGSNGLREMAELNDDLNGVNALEDGANGGLAAEYWSEAVFDEELMTSRTENRRPDAGPGNPGIPDNPISALTIAAMEDLGYTVDYGEADFFRLDPGAVGRQTSQGQATSPATPLAQSTAQQRLLADLPNADAIPNGAAYIYARPNVLSESPGSFALNDANSELVLANGTNVVLIEAVTGETLNIELTGTFSKNNPAEISQLSGTVDSMEVRSLDGQLLFSVDYTQEPTTVADVAAQWPNYAIDGENIIIVDTLPGAVVRVNPNGGGPNDNRIFTGASDDFVRGGDLAELINGGADNDTLEGENGNDSLVGEAGNDRLEGGRGNDLVNGGAGIDTAAFSGAQSAYTLTLSAGSTVIQDRRGDGNGQDTLIGIERLDFDTDFFDGIPFDLQQFAGTTGLSVTDFENFIELYIAYFNRAPDAVGLNFWGTAFANGVSLAESAGLFVNQVETLAAYPTDLSNSDLVATIYQNVLGRIPDQAGFEFWVNALDSGGIGRDIAILGILGGAKADPPTDATQDFVDQQLADRAFLANKTDIGAYFAVHKGMSDPDHASEAMGLFDGSAGSITNAVARIDTFHDAALNANTGEFLMPLIGVLDDPF